MVRASRSSGLEAQLAGQFGERLERGVGLVVRPSLDVLQEQEASDIPQVRRRSSGGAVGTTSVGGLRSLDQLGEEAVEAPSSVTEERSIPSVVPALKALENLLGVSLFQAGVLWSVRGRSAASAGVCRHNRRRGAPSSRRISTGNGCRTKLIVPSGRRVSGHNPVDATRGVAFERLSPRGGRTPPQPFNSSCPAASPSRFQAHGLGDR